MKKLLIKIMMQNNVLAEGGTQKNKNGSERLTPVQFVLICAHKEQKILIR